MSVPPRRLLSYAEYLDLEAQTGRKHEYIDGMVTAMTGGSIAHALLVSVVGRELWKAINPTSCRVHSSEQRVRIPGGSRVYYPDASVTCGPLQVDPDDPHAIYDASLLVEVLSPHTARYDHLHKVVEYQRLPSCRAIWLVNTTRVAVERWRRDDAGEWGQTLHGRSDRIPLGDDRWVPVAAIYDGVTLDRPERI